MNIVSEQVYVEQKVYSFGPMSRKGIPKSYANEEIFMGLHL